MPHVTRNTETHLCLRLYRQIHAMPVWGVQNHLLTFVSSGVCIHTSEIIDVVFICVNHLAQQNM